MYIVVFRRLSSPEIRPDSSEPLPSGGAIPESTLFWQTDPYWFPADKASLEAQVRPRKGPKAAEVLSEPQAQPLISVSCTTQQLENQLKFSQPWECSMHSTWTTADRLPSGQAATKSAPAATSLTYFYSLENNNCLKLSSLYLTTCCDRHI